MNLNDSAGVILQNIRRLHSASVVEMDIAEAALEENDATDLVFQSCDPRLDQMLALLLAGHHHEAQALAMQVTAKALYDYAEEKYREALQHNPRALRAYERRAA